MQRALCKSSTKAVLGQATINLGSQVWKSLQDSLPKLYCIDLVEAYVTQESASSRILCEKKRYDLPLPNGRLHQKPSAIGRKGKENWVLSLVPGSSKCLALRNSHILCQKHGGARTTCYLKVPKV